jgi:hypothetical protein
MRLTNDLKKNIKEKYFNSVVSANIDKYNELADLVDKEVIKLYNTFIKHYSDYLKSSAIFVEVKKSYAFSVLHPTKTEPNGNGNLPVYNVHLAPRGLKPENFNRQLSLQNWGMFNYSTSLSLIKLGFDYCSRNKDAHEGFLVNTKLTELDLLPYEKALQNFQEFENIIKASLTAAFNVIDSYGSTTTLERAWPELVKFIPSETKNVVAVLPSSDLNKLANLP